MSDVLVLNAGFLPIELITAKEAICLLYQNKAYIVTESDKVMRSPSVTFKVPHVIALLKYKDIPKRKVNFSKLNILYRDDLTCQYCGKQLPINQLTIDHIIPRSRWLEFKKKKEPVTSWLNCTTACRFCNNKKGNKLLQETDMKLINQPFEPKYIPKIIVSYEKAERKGWLPFAKFNIKLVYSPE